MVQREKTTNFSIRVPNSILSKMDTVANTMLDEKGKPVGRTSVINAIFKHLPIDYIQEVMRSYGFQYGVDRFIQQGGSNDQIQTG